jgi:hypothetical protein
MAGTFPRFRLYDSTGVSLIYEFENVTDWGNTPFLDPITFSEHVSLRGQGSIISEGSQAPWDLSLNFMLIEEDYEALVAILNTLSTTIANNTKYVLKIDLTSITTKDLKVKRLETIQFPVTRNKKVVTFQEGIITLRVDCWA